MTWFQRKGNKYGAKKTNINGYIYDSKKEATRGQELELLLRAREIIGFNRQTKISFDVCRICKRLCSERCEYHPNQKVFHITNYFIDFVVEENDETETYEEVKSKATKTDVWRIKWKLTEALFGDDPKKKLVVID